MKLNYVAPSGEEVKNVDIATLLPMVRKGGSSYWNIGSGGGLLTWGDPNRQRAMEIYFVPRHGFHLIYRAPGKAPLAAEPAAPVENSKRVQIYIGGEAEPISTSQVVGREDAEAALRHFAEQRMPWPELRWTSPR